MPAATKEQREDISRAYEEQYVQNNRERYLDILMTALSKADDMGFRIRVRHEQFHVYSESQHMGDAFVFGLEDSGKNRDVLHGLIGAVKQKKEEMDAALERALLRDQARKKLTDEEWKAVTGL